ncbi:MAG: DMT family transporter [Candidatus Micrarchaeota archaeon]
MDSRYGKGILLALLAALISGVSVFINGSAIKLADPFAYTTLKNLGALLFLWGAVLAFNEVRHFRNLSKRQWSVLALIGVIGGSVPFLMFFWGLKLGGAAISSFIFRSLFIFAGVAGWFILKEKPEASDVAAGVILLLGNALLVSGDLEFGFGQMLVLGATILWAVEYTISRKMLSDIEPNVVMVSRMIFGSLVLLGFLAMDGSLGLLTQINPEMLSWLVLTSALLFGFLTSWYNTLRYLPVLKATSILALGGIVTSALGILCGGTVSLAEGFGLLLILLGAGIAAGSANLVSSLKKTVLWYYGRD